MKKLILISIASISFAQAKSQLASEGASIKAAVRNIEQINTVVQAPSTNDCREEEVELARDVKEKSSDIKVIVCRPDNTSLLQPTGENYEQLIRENNIEFHPNASAITGTRDWRLFVHELKKFPADLRRELAQAGNKIRVLIGDGVSEDPQWQLEKQKAVEAARAYREWYYHPKTKDKDRQGKPVPLSDAEVARGFESTTEGARQWDTVSGAGGVFTGGVATSPTRIVLNRMYFSAHREADGKVSYNRMQGATNLFLHEQAHSMDNIYGAHTISHSEDWLKVMQDPAVKAYLPKIFSSYETDHAEEGFAEAFSYYHSCEASRSQMEKEAPLLAAYFKEFSVEKLRKLKPAK